MPCPRRRARTVGLRHSTCGSRLGWLIASFCLVLALVATATAEDTPEASAPAVAPGRQIATRAQALEKRLEEIQAQRPTRVLEQIGAQLADLQTTAAAAVQRTESLLTGPATSVEIEAQASRCRILDHRFDELEERVRDEADKLDRALAEMAEQTELWRQSRSESHASGAPEAVLRTADLALEHLAAAKTQVNGDLASALQLLQRFEDARRDLRPMLDRLAEAQRAFTSGLWVRQRDPVWRAIPASDELLALPDEIGSRLFVVWAEFGPQVRDRRDAIVYLTLFFLVLGWLLRRLHAARARLWPERTAEEADALRHPWAAAYLIAMLMTPFLRLSDIRGLRLLFMPVGIAALWLVLSRMVTTALRGPLAGLGLLSLFELFRFVLPELPSMNRLVMGLDLALALAGVIWLRHPDRLRQLPWQALTVPWLTLLTPVLSVGLLAALFGYTTLADSLALFSIWGSILGVAWAAFVRIGEAVIEQLVEAEHLAALRMAQTSRAAFVHVLRRILQGIGIFGWVYGALGISGLWIPFRSALDAVLSASIGFGTVSISLGGVLAFFLTIWLSWLLARFVSFTLDQEVFSRVQTPPGVSFALSTFARYTILVFGFLVAMGAVGFSLDRVALLLGALGVGIGFGLQNVVNNFVSGLILLFERPIRVGDWVQLGELFGIVSKIGIRSSMVRTFDGADVVVPNGDLVSEQLINWTLSDRKRRVILPVGVAYGTAPRRVIELLLEVARGHEEVLANPEPVALFRGFGDSALNFELRVFTEGDWLRVLSDLAVATTEALEAAGITIPFPQRDLHLRNIPELRDALKQVVEHAGDDGSPGPPR